MKNILCAVCIFTLLFQVESAAQSLPDFLHGTWQMENKEIYEHWDTLNEKNMKGFSYKIKNGKMIISEYLDINIKGNKVVYTATVLNQNDGKGIDFTLTNSDASFVFENPEHDFPKKIEYQKLSDTEILVNVSDGGQEGFSYKMNKLKKLQAEE